MIDFVGRTRELGMLGAALESVRSRIGGRAPGKCVMLRGRRRVGKSALVEEFSRRAGVPSVYFTASNLDSETELENLLGAVAGSDLPEREHYLGTQPPNWNAALGGLVDALPETTPSLIVLDEVPYLMEQVPSFEGILQRVWDRQLSRKPVLLLLVGSDLSRMKALNSYDRPFHQRGTEMILGPMNPAEVGEMLGLEPAEAFDAALVTGGLPLICADWQRGTGLWDFLGRSLANPISALTVSAELMLGAEFPAEAMASRVLRAIGSGERTFTNIARAGDLNHMTLHRALEMLSKKGIVSMSLPLSLRPSKERRYTIADPYLRFWLALIEPHLAEIDRRRGDLVIERIRRSWTSWRGRAIEPLIRESLARVLPVGTVPYARYIGGYWTRKNDVEIDIVGAEAAPVAKELLFLGSVKWLESSKFDRRDLTALQNHRAAVTDQAVPLIAVSRSGFDCEGLDARFDAADLIRGWSG